MELTIGSINARGLGDRSKRREFFNWLRKKQMAIYFIQEAHFLDVEKDKKGGLAKTHKKSLEVINSYSEDLNLIDVWRIQNPEQRRFTWRQKNPEIQCRLDFFLVSQ
ncbi:unnamed protein product, partial [Porites lobata]